MYESGYWSGAKLKNAGPAYYYTKDHHSMSGGGSDKGYPTERSLAFLKKVLTEEDWVVINVGGWRLHTCRL